MIQKSEMKISTDYIIPRKSEIGRQQGWRARAVKLRSGGRVPRAVDTEEEHREKILDE